MGDISLKGRSPILRQGFAASLSFFTPLLMGLTAPPVA